MSKCKKCGSDGCDACDHRGYVTDCTLERHWGTIGGKRYPLVLDEGSGRHRFRANPSSGTSWTPPPRVRSST